jgi:hypothetical protein
MSSSFWAVGFSPIFSPEDGNYRFAIHFDRDLWSRGRLLQQPVFWATRFTGWGSGFCAHSFRGLACSHPGISCRLLPARKQLRRYRNLIRSEHGCPAGMFR